MFRRVKPQITYANVVATLALFLAIGGGTAFAVVAANQVDSKSIINGQVKKADLDANSVGPGKVINGSLTGDDVKPNSIDRCPGQGTLTVRLGKLCVDVPSGTRDWIGSLNYCEELGLRLPTYSEARTLGEKFDIPNIADEVFWTDAFFKVGSNPAAPAALVAIDGLNYAYNSYNLSDSLRTVCVTTPTG